MYYLVGEQVLQKSLRRGTKTRRNKTEWETGVYITQIRIRLKYHHRFIDGCRGQMFEVKVSVPFSVLQKGVNNFRSRNNNTNPVESTT